MGIQSTVCILFVVTLCSGKSIQAAPYSHYFTIEKIPEKMSVRDSASDESEEFFSPSILWQDLAFSELAQNIRASFSLLDFVRHDQALTPPAIPYQRERDFGGWVREAIDSSCKNTRAHVLIRDSQEPVKMAPNQCTVERGEWKDPYTGQTFVDARDIQIDHFVPLKNAYVHGASEWSRMERCLFGNFMGAPYHLLPVFGVENQTKSDKGIEAYLPPAKAYLCQYVSQWLKIKYIWKLKLNPNEVATVQRLLQRAQCQVEDFAMSEKEENEIQNYKAQNARLCERAR